MTHEQMDYLTSEELVSKAGLIKKLGQCQATTARVLDDLGNVKYVLLVSYQTVVANYIVGEQVLLVRGRYSQTTYQHVRKFRNAMGREFNVAPWNIEELNAEIDDWFDRPKRNGSNSLCAGEFSQLNGKKKVKRKEEENAYYL